LTGSFIVVAFANFLQEEYDVYVRTALLVAWLSVGLTGQPATLRPGSVIPQFRLPDQNGKLMSLKDIAGPNGAMLVFYRSADW